MNGKSERVTRDEAAALSHGTDYARLDTVSEEDIARAIAKIADPGRYDRMTGAAS